MKCVLEMKGISKSFPGVDVFKGFDFDVSEGEVHCICGENGAGKSTLIKMLSGALKPDNGTISVNGKVVTNNSPRKAINMGVQTIYQEHNLYPQLNVIENLFAGNELGHGLMINKSTMLKKTQEILDFLDSDVSPYAIVGSLGSGEKKIVEIARGFIQECKVMILDEPTASFSQKEICHLLKLIKKLSDEGISIIYISHHLEEVFQIADRVTVIRDGEKISTYNIDRLSEEQLISDMVGRDVSAFYNREKVNIQQDYLMVKNLSGNGVEDVSFRVRKGECLGIAGMVGSGRTELVELIFGAAKIEAGQIWINNRKIRIDTPLDAINNGICFITENRQETGLFLQHSLVKNTVIASYVKTKKLLTLPSKDNEMTSYYINKLKVVTPSIFQDAVFLSGGNQQKIVLAKWFATNADIFIFDEPTRGIDVGAKEEIYKIMTELLKEGKSIIMVSSDMPELIAMSDRVIVMKNGKIVAKIEEQINEENILRYSIGGLQC